MKTARFTGFIYLGALFVLSQYPGALASSQTRSLAGAPTSQPPRPDTASAQNTEIQSIDLQDADSLLRAAVPRTLRNRREAMAYTYEIDYRNRNFTPRGKLLADYSARYEVIFVGDLPYRRQIEENHKPLSGPAAAQEAQRFDQAFAERSRMSIVQKRDYLRRPWNVDVPLPQLAALFASRITGEEEVNGRPAIVVESRPRADVRPMDEEERRALHKQVKLWIDREDLVASRIEATIIADDALMKAGTVARIDFERKDLVWLPVQSDVRFRAMDGPEIVSGETIESNSDFRRFHVDVRLLQPAETAGTPKAQ